MKNHKPLSSKKPPTPIQEHEPIADWIADAKPALNPIVKKLDACIRNNLSDPRYAIKWGKAYYGTPKLGWCIELVAYDVSVNVVFLNGSDLSSPPEMGDETRYVKITEVADLDSDDLQGWIQESCGIGGWRW